MHERGKAVEGGLIECQTCEKKIYVVKKILGKIFQNFFSLNLILSYILNYFHHFQPFLYYKKCARLKEVIRRNFDQCVDRPCSIIVKQHVAIFLLEVKKSITTCIFEAATFFHILQSWNTYYILKSKERVRLDNSLTRMGFCLFGFLLM